MAVQAALRTAHCNCILRTLILLFPRGDDYILYNPILLQNLYCLTFSFCTVVYTYRTVEHNTLLFLWILPSTVRARLGPAVVLHLRPQQPPTPPSIAKQNGQDRSRRTSTLFLVSGSEHEVGADHTDRLACFLIILPKEFLALGTEFRDALY
jgi:hypothetical protein